MYFIWDTDQIYTSGDSSYQLAGQIEKILDRIKLFAITKTHICLQNIFMLFARVLWSVYQICRGSWKLQTGTFFYLFLIHSVFVYLEAINFVGTLILAISVESLWARSGSPEYSWEAHHYPPSPHQQAGSTIPQSSLINDIKSIAHGHTYCLSAWLESNAKKISMSVENCDLESKISWRHQGLKYTFFLESWSVKLWNCPMYVICVQWWKLWWSWEHWLEH